MQLTGFTDEAGFDLATQIKATQALGWSHMSLRGIAGTNVHELSDEAFAQAADQIDASGLKVAEFGSLIGNWGKKITGDFQVTVDEINRCIPRMQRLGVQIVRVMSYAQEPFCLDSFNQTQHVEERVSRLREIVRRFADAGLTAAHENCMNYGGFGASYSLQLVEQVPGLKLIFDTGNPVFQPDRDAYKQDPSLAIEQAPWQDPWAFYQAVKEHIVHVHVKDCRMAEGAKHGDEPAYLMPGEGDGRVFDILNDLDQSGYDGFVAIEPHVATVFHVQDGQEPDWQQCFDSYVAYGKALEAGLKAQ